MKHSAVVLLGLLLLANAGLVAAYLQRTENNPGVGQPAPGAQSAVAGAEIGRPPEAPAPANSRATPGLFWERVYSGDPRTFAERLRAAGVPDRAARLLVGDALRKAYLERQHELIGSAEPSGFWLAASAAADRDKQAALRRLARDQAALLRELYGPDDLDAAELERLRRLHGPLPDEKLQRIERIASDYGAMADDIRNRTGGLLLATDREILALLEQEKHKDIAAILTPEEQELHELQSSPAARSLRARLAAFAPTEKEFRALYALQREFEARCAAAGGSDEERERTCTAAQQDLDTRIARALGAARFAEYSRQQQPEFRIVARIAERFGLPTQRADVVCTVADEIRARLLALRSDRTLQADTVRRSLAALGREADTKLTALLTADGAELYKETSCGAWLRALERVGEEPASGVAVPSAATTATPLSEGAVLVDKPAAPQS